MARDEPRSIISWGLYDWANSAFATTVMAGFFPVFFKQYWSIGVDVSVSTARLGAANSLAGIVVALSAPVLGAIADRGRAKKRFLVFFAFMGAVMTSALYLIGRGEWTAAIALYAAATLGFSGGNIFYDSLLSGVASESRFDTVSSLGFGLGYL
ncbi:MAG: MFS transporter, partial [Desulfobacteraceae bacterium]